MTPGYREPGHSHLQSAKDCPTCHGRAESTSQAQAEADKVQQRRLSELQALNEGLRRELDEWHRRAETAEAVLAGVTSALETLFNSVPQRWVSLGDPGAALDLDPSQIMLLPDAPERRRAEQARTALCVVTDWCEAPSHMPACPNH